MSTVMAKDLATSATDALAAAVGTSQVGATSQPMPQLNGLLLQLPGAAPVYLVLNGYRCWVPDPTTFNNLFVSGASIVQDINIGVVSEGPALSSGAVLASAAGSPTVYLITDGEKWGIPSMDIFTRYQFNSSNIESCAPVIINAVPNGPNVDGPTS